jgi:hypothetical protein
MTDPPLLPLLARRAAGSSRLKDQKTKRPKDDELKNGNTERPSHRATRRVAVWLMDLYPEALAASGRIGRNNPLYQWYFNQRQRVLGAADFLICLGEAQKKRLETKSQPEVGGRRPEPRLGEMAIRQTGDGLQSNQLTKDQEQEELEVSRQEAVGTEALQHRNTATPRPPLTQRVRTAVVPPWDDRGNIALATEESLRNLALYAGNLGEAHCFEEILAAAPHLPGDWTIRFAARGAKLGALKEKAEGISHSRPQGDRQLEELSEVVKLTRMKGSAESLLVSSSFGLFSSVGARVEITGYASEEETPGLLASARVHLITMSPGWEGIVVPSKLYGCIRTGRPVLFVGPENADTAREIRAHDWGMALPPGANGEEVAAAILELAARPTRATESQNGAREIAKLLETLATD